MAGMALRTSTQLERICARLEADTLLRDQLIRQMSRDGASLAEIRAATGERLSRSGILKILNRPDNEA